MVDYNTLTNAELVSIYNTLAKKHKLPAVKRWSKAKTILIERIESLSAKKVVKAKPAKKESRKPDPALPSIRETALKLLSHVEYCEDRTRHPSDDNRVSANEKNARTVGLPYDEIVRRIHSMFPDAQTSVACLRWYTVKIRVNEFGYEGYTLPQRRPRAPNKR